MSAAGPSEEGDETLYEYTKDYPSRNPMKEYATDHEMTYDFDYDYHKIMFSQKGSTCYSDALFTTLFESDILKPYLASIDWSSKKACNDSIACAFELASLRYARMKEKEEKIPKSVRLRRQLSIENNVGDSVRRIIGKCEKGMDSDKMFDFVERIFVKNELGIKGIDTDFQIGSFGEVKTLFPNAETIKNIIAFMLVLRGPIDDGAHAIGFVKNGDDWYLLDNNIGFIHKIQDSNWFNKVFMRRLFNESLQLDYSSVENMLKELVLFRFNSKLVKYDLAHQIITFGEKLYPNVVVEDIFTIPIKSMQSPTNLIWISYNGPKSPRNVSAGAGAGAGAGATRRGGSRQQQRRTRRSRRL